MLGGQPGQSLSSTFILVPAFPSQSRITTQSIMISSITTIILAFAAIMSATPVALEPRSTTVAPSGWTYVGCAAEPFSGRLLPLQIANTSTNTHNSCTASCSAAGYAYAGMEFGGECYCGNSAGSSSAPLNILNDGRCSTACSGEFLLSPHISYTHDADYFLCPVFSSQATRLRSAAKRTSRPSLS